MTDIPGEYASGYLSGDVYKTYYPPELYEVTINSVVNDRHIHHEKRDAIYHIMQDTQLTMFEKFCRFIDMMNKEDLLYIGW